jgi:capsular polysaccharide biosynthesis protein
MQETVSVGAVHDLGHYTRPLRRHKALIMVCTLVCLALGGYASKGVHPTYTSSARVLVLTDITDQGSGNTTGGRTSGTVNLDTEAQLVKSEKLADAVQSLLHTSASPANLTSRLTVTVPANTPVLDLTFKAATANSAQRGAAAFATAYLDNRASVAKASLQLQTTAVNTAISAQQTKLRSVTNTIATAPSGSAEQDYAKQEQTQLNQVITVLNQQLSGLTTAPIVAGRIISPAGAGAKQNLSRDVVIVSGALLGILLGLIAAFVRDRSGTKVRNRDDLAEASLRTVGENRRKSRVPRRHRRVGLAGVGAEHQAAVSFASAVGPRGVIYVAGVSSVGAASRIGGRIAAELRRFGATVQMIQVEPVSGASPDLPQRGAATGAAGDPPTWFVTLAGLHAAGLREQIAANRDRVDYVLIAGGDAERSSEAYLVASTADATLLVAESGVTTRKGLRAVADEVRQTSTNLVGALLVRPERGGSLTDGLFARGAKSGGAASGGAKSGPAARREKSGESAIKKPSRVFERPPV